MKIILILTSILFINCADSKIINGKDYDTYGLISKDEVKDKCIKYRLVTGNIVWGILLSETVIAPLYFFGWSLWEPQYKLNCKEQD